MLDHELSGETQLKTLTSRGASIKEPSQFEDIRALSTIENSNIG